MSLLARSCRHIVIDRLSVAICSAIVSGPPIPPAFIGSSQGVVDFALKYEASDNHLEDTSLQQHPVRL
jgi:hypothetical protein